MLPTGDDRRKVDKWVAIRHEQAMAKGTAKVPAGPVLDHLSSLRGSGHTWTSIAMACGLPVTTVKSVSLPNCSNYVRDKILSVEPLSGDEFAHTGEVPTVGLRRIVEAAQYAGYSMATVAMESGLREQQLSKALYRKAVHAKTERTFWLAAERLLSTTPERYGCSPQTITKARRRAKQMGFAPWLAWDSDTIRDPNAFPNYTGECGTIQGYRVHKDLGHQFPSERNPSETVQACPACMEAHRRYASRQKWEAQILAQYGLARAQGRQKLDYETEQMIQKVLAKHADEYVYHPNKAKRS